MVLVILAILITMVIPSMIASKSEANETAAATTLRNIVQAQVEFVTRQSSDQNSNGTGEYGTLGELSGGVPIRETLGGTVRLSPVALVTAFQTVTANGEVMRQGYFFRVYLPDSSGDGVRELAGGGVDPTVDDELAETAWCVYAWPQRYGTTGRRTMFANQNGDILYTESSTYTGANAPITAGAAFTAPGGADNMLGRAAVGVAGRDGNTWKAVVR